MSSTKLKEQPGYEGHGEPSNPPSVKKGKFEGIGTYMDCESMTSTSPTAQSPNVKSGQNAGSGRTGS